MPRCVHSSQKKQKQALVLTYNRLGHLAHWLLHLIPHHTHDPNCIQCILNLRIIRHLDDHTSLQNHCEIHQLDLDHHYKPQKDRLSNHIEILRPNEHSSLQFLATFLQINNSCNIIIFNKYGQKFGNCIKAV